MPAVEPVGVDFVDRASTVVSTDIDIPVPVHEVWGALVDNNGWTEWFDGMREVKPSVARWSSAGDTRSIKAGPLSIDEVAVELAENARWAMCFVRTNLPLAKRAIEVVDLRDSSREGEQRTELRWTLGADLHPFVAPFGGLIEAKFAKTWATSFENLYDYLRPGS